MMSNAGAKPGEILILTKALGTGFVTTANKAGKCSAEHLLAATDSMAMLNRAASEAAVAHGATASTDITGFGLAGHAAEMAQSSGVTLQLHGSQLPILPGAEELAAKGFRTRATETNMDYTRECVRYEGEPRAVTMDMLYDAQTSGGLLISVAADRAEALLEQVRGAGAEAAAMVGEVMEQESAALVVREQA
jgi:selenide,water dikinase